MKPALAILVFATSLNLSAATDQERIASLENTVAVQEKRIIALERAVLALAKRAEEVAPAPAVAADQPPTPARPAKPQLKLRHGMSMEEVEKLLGTPTRTEAPLLGVVYWIYGTGPSYSSPRVEYFKGSVNGWDNWP